MSLLLLPETRTGDSSARAFGIAVVHFVYCRTTASYYFSIHAESLQSMGAEGTGKVCCFTWAQEVGSNACPFANAGRHQGWSCHV